MQYSESKAAADAGVAAGDRGGRSRSQRIQWYYPRLIEDKSEVWESPDDSGLVVFVHIPKSAGSTFHLLLLRNASNGMLRMNNVFKGGGGTAVSQDDNEMVKRLVVSGRPSLLAGHTPFSVADVIPDEWRPRYVTVLRDPVDRAISHYYQLLSAAPRPSAPERAPLDAIDRAGGGVSGSVTRSGAAAPREPLSVEVPYSRALSGVDYVPDNLQTRMLCGEPRPFGAVTGRMLEQAMSNLERRFVMFGLTERFDESVVLLKHRLGHRCLLAPSQRVSHERPRGAAVPGGLVEAAKRANQFDIELYRFACDLFDRTPEFEMLEYQLDLAARRMADAATYGLAADRDLSPPAQHRGDQASWEAAVRARAELLRLETERSNARRRLLQQASDHEWDHQELCRLQAETEQLRRRNAQLRKKLAGARGAPVTGRAAGPTPELGGDGVRPEVDRPRKKRRAAVADLAGDGQTAAPPGINPALVRARLRELKRERRVLRAGLPTSDETSVDPSPADRGD